MSACGSVDVEMRADVRVGVGVNASALDLDHVVLLDSGADGACGVGCCASCVGCNVMVPTKG